MLYLKFKRHVILLRLYFIKKRSIGLYKFWYNEFWTSVSEPFIRKSYDLLPVQPNCNTVEVCTVLKADVPLRYIQINLPISNVIHLMSTKIQFSLDVDSFFFGMKPCFMESTVFDLSTYKSTKEDNGKKTPIFRLLMPS